MLRGLLAQGFPLERLPGPDGGSRTRRVVSVGIVRCRPTTGEIIAGKIRKGRSRTRNSPLVVCRRAEDSRVNLHSGIDIAFGKVLAAEAVSAVMSAEERRLGSRQHGWLLLVVRPPKCETRWQADLTA